MKARRLFYSKKRLPDGSIVEMVIWQLPGSDRERPHSLKYRLYYGKGGKRLVGYDNERGKGDHKHVGDVEYPYNFVSVRRLMTDFLSDIKRLRGLC